MLSKVKKVFSNKSRKFSNSKSNENCRTSSVVSVTSSLPDFTREFSTLTEECGYVPTVLVNASKIIEAHIEDKYLFQTQGSLGKVDYLIQILGRDRLSVPRNINIHDVVEAVKVYLNRKATPIVPDEIMTKLIENHSAGCTEEDIRIISQYRKMLPDVVPSVHYVLMLMNKVSKLSHINGMDERKLATIFVLDILKPLSISETHEDFEKNRLERVQKLPYNIMVVEHLIRNVHIFEFAPYQQIHEPFVSPPDEINSTTKEKNSKYSKASSSSLTGHLQDPRLFPRSDAKTNHSQTAPKHSRVNLLAKTNESGESTPPRNAMCTKEAPGVADKALVQVPSLYKQQRSRESVRKSDNSKRYSKVAPSVSTVHNPEVPGVSHRRENTDCSGRPTRSDHREGKRSTENSRIKMDNSGSKIKKENSGVNRDNSVVKKDNSGIKKDNSGIKRVNSGTTNKIKVTSRTNNTGTLQQTLSYRASSEYKSEMILDSNSNVRKRSENPENRALRTHSCSPVTKVQMGSVISQNSPARNKRQDKTKKATASSSYSANYARSPNRTSPRNSLDISRETPKRSNVNGGSVISKYAKRGRLKEAKKRMFRKDEELQPWDGWITESEDISLIVRTTKNPKTFQFLEKYFMALDPDGKIEKIVFDASTSSQQQETQTSAKKKSRRNRNKSSTSPRYKGKYGSYAANTTGMRKSVSQWSTRKGGEKRNNRLDMIVSSPDLHSSVASSKANTPKVCPNAQKDEVNNELRVKTENSPLRNVSDTQVYTSSTQINTKGGLKVECKNSVAWASSGDMSFARNIKKMEPKGHTSSYWQKIFDWVIDTSLISIAFFCAAYIYNVI